jgi:Protein of unknown function (DUF1566)
MQIRATVSSLLVVILIAIVRTPASAQFSTTASGVAQETQARGFWTDPSTGLMWAGKDNGKGVSWKKAVKYCGDLRLAGYSDWRLATLAELETFGLRVVLRFRRRTIGQRSKRVPVPLLY